MKLRVAIEAEKLSDVVAWLGAAAATIESRAVEVLQPGVIRPLQLGERARGTIMLEQATP